MSYQVIALDADDTLWHNERIFTAIQTEFSVMLSQYHPPEWIDSRLYETEKKNLKHFGYGAKGFTLSMIETAIDLTEGRIGGLEVQRIINLGRSIIAAPVELLDGVAETIQLLSSEYRLMLLTKGDLFDQESKLARSGLGELFAAIEIVSEKDSKTYAAVMKRHAVAPGDFLMVGNSVRSDILPVLDAGGAAVHIPYHTTWAHEVVPAEELEGRSFATLERIAELPDWLARS